MDGIERAVLACLSSEQGETPDSFVHLLVFHSFVKLRPLPTQARATLTSKEQKRVTITG
jgi:hypothetical protein